MLHTKKFIGHIFIYNLFLIVQGHEEIFKQNLAKDMEIGLPDGGYKSVKLKCGSNSMQVHLETLNDFSGVIYTRGNFHDKDQSCFLDPGFKRGQRSFTIHFPLDKCNTLQKGEVYSNVLVVQNDKDLILPGDAAFNLECDFRKSRDITVEAKLQKSTSVVSKITMTNPDLTEDHLRETREAVISKNNEAELFCRS